jgi:hypothetical protein
LSKVDEVSRVARFFMVHDTKTGKNEHKMAKIPIVLKIFKTAIKPI